MGLLQGGFYSTCRHIKWTPILDLWLRCFLPEPTALLSATRHEAEEDCA